MPIGNGEDVDATNSNRAFLDRESDDTALGIIALANGEPASGATVVNTQGAINNTAADVGGTTYSSNNVISNGDDHATALGDLDERFDASSGHTHNATSGGGPQLNEFAFVPGVALLGRRTRASDLSTVTGTSSTVTSEFGGKTPSTLVTVQGVVVNSANNIIPLRVATASIDRGKPLTDANGNEIFGRLTESSNVWTLSFFSFNSSGVETSHNFVSSVDIQWWYQEIFHPMNSTQIYDENAEAYIGSASSGAEVRKGSESLGNGDNEHTITFSSDFSTAVYQININIVNVTDGSPLVIPGLTITAKTTSTCTFTTPTQLDSANYLADYRAELL